MQDIKLFFKDKRNLFNLLSLVIIVLALPIGVSIIRQQQVISSRADVEPVVFSGPNITQRNGVKVATAPSVTLEITSPLGPPVGTVSQADSSINGFEFAPVAKAYVPGSGDLIQGQTCRADADCMSGSCLNGHCGACNQDEVITTQKDSSGCTHNVQTRTDCTTYLGGPYNCPSSGGSSGGGSSGGSPSGGGSSSGGTNLPNGAACTTDGQCSSGNCCAGPTCGSNRGTCQNNGGGGGSSGGSTGGGGGSSSGGTNLPNGTKCTYDGQCSSGNCCAGPTCGSNRGTCQPETGGSSGTTTPPTNVCGTCGTPGNACCDPGKLCTPGGAGAGSYCQDGYLCTNGSCKQPPPPPPQPKTCEGFVSSCVANNTAGTQWCEKGVVLSDGTCGFNQNVTTVCYTERGSGVQGCKPAIVPGNQPGTGGGGTGNTGNNPPPAQNQPLSVSCSVTPTGANIGDAVIWHAEAAGGSGSYTYSWSGSDALSGKNTRLVQMSYNNAGTKVGVVTVTDSAGSQKNADCGAVTVNSTQTQPGSPLMVSCGISPTQVNTNESASWYAQASGGSGPYTFAWSGTTPLAGKSGNIVDTSYQSAGTKTGFVTVKDSTGQETQPQNCGTLSVNSPTGGSTVQEPLSFSCGATPGSAGTGETVSWFVQPSGGSGSYTYSWSGAAPLSGKTSKIVEVGYPSAGNKSGIVTVRDSEGHELTQNCGSVSVNAPSGGPTPPASQPLSVSCSATPNSATAGESVIWHVQASGGSGGYNYNWSGTAPLVGKTDKVADVSYNNPGTKVGVVTVRDSQGAELIQDCGMVSISAPASGPAPAPATPLSLNCSAIPSGAKTGESVGWFAQPSGGTAPYSYAWSGTQPLEGRTDKIVNLNYSNEGVKAGIVTVKDSAGQEFSQNCGTVNIQNPPPQPQATPSPLNASCSATPNSATAGESVIWHVQASGGSGNYSYNWDGSESLKSKKDKIVDVSYNGPGTKVGLVTIKDSTGMELTQDCGSVNVQPRPTAAPTPSPAPATASFKVAENPSDLATAPVVSYSQEPTLVQLNFKDPTPGKKFVWIEFTSSTGRVERRNVSIDLVGPDPVLSAVSCNLDVSGSGVVFKATGKNFGSGQGKFDSDQGEAEVLDWKDNSVTGHIEGNPTKTSGSQSYKVTVNRPDGQQVSGVCKIGVSQLLVDAKLFCHQPGDLSQDNVMFSILQNDQGAKIQRQKVNMDKDGAVSDLSRILQVNKSYSVGIKIPYGLRRVTTFTAQEGTTIIPSITLPVGDIYPVDTQDGKINSVDKAELNREWGISSQPRSGDFNKDGQVNALDWSCMRANFDKEDEPEPAAPAATAK